MTDTDTEDERDAPHTLGRLLFGGVLAFMAIDNFRNPEAMTGYAEAKGVPSPDLSVPLGSGALLFGGVGVALWRLPALAAGAIATFLVATNARIHDFWNLEGEEAQQEQVQFLKNSALLGAAVVLLRRATRD